ncbi:MAG: hypothetical protein EZS28_055478, partial [Streblomastix strix]
EKDRRCTQTFKIDSQLGEYRYYRCRKERSNAIFATIGTGYISDPIAVEVHWFQIQWQWQRLEQQILLITSNLCKLGHELTEYLEYCTAGLLETIQLELDRTLVTIAQQFMATVQLSRTLLATDATSTNDEHAKVPQTEFGQQPCASLTAAAVRREEQGERSCGSCINRRRRGSFDWRQGGSMSENRWDLLDSVGDEALD